MTALTFVTATDLGCLPVMRTGSCLYGSAWAHRDDEFDDWFPPTQQRQEACRVGSYRLARRQTFKEMAIGALNVSWETPVNDIARLLWERRLVLSLSQLDKLASMQNEGVEAGIRTNGWDNLAFAGYPSQNALRGTFAVGISRDAIGFWRASVFLFTDSRQWPGSRHLLLRNMDAARL